MPLVASRWDHPDVGIDYSAALQASQKGFEQICLNGDYLGHDSIRFLGGHFAGIGSTDGEWRLWGTKEFVTEEFGSFFTLTDTRSGDRQSSARHWESRGYWLVLGNIEVTRTYCMEVSSHIEVKILDRNTGWEVIAPPGRSIVTVPAAVGRGGDFRLFVRCPLGECAPPPLAGAWEQLELLIAAMRLDFDSLGQESVAHYRTTLEAAKVYEFESILWQILTNWRDWRDRVERGHPVFEIETEDLQRQCDRAREVTSQLDEIGATDYREWFDVCVEP